MLTMNLRHCSRRLAASDASVLFCGKGAAGKTTLMRHQHTAGDGEVLIVESDARFYQDKPYCIEQKEDQKEERGRKARDTEGPCS